MKRLALVIGVFSVGGLLLWLGVLRRSSGDGGKTAESHSTPSAEGDLNARLDALEAENRKVRRELALTRLATEDVSQKVQAAGAAKNGSESEALKAAKKANLSARQDISVEAFEKDLQVRASTEVSDGRWTMAVEGAFRQTLANMEGAARFESARCGSSLCTVVVSHQDDRGHVDLVNALQGRTTGFAGQFLVRRHSNPAGGYRTSFYFSKPGEQLPDLSSALAGEY